MTIIIIINTIIIIINALLIIIIIMRCSHRRTMQTPTHNSHAIYWAFQAAPKTRHTWCDTRIAYFTYFVCHILCVSHVVSATHIVCVFQTLLVLRILCSPNILCFIYCLCLVMVPKQDTQWCLPDTVYTTLIVCVIYMYRVCHITLPRYGPHDACQPYCDVHCPYKFLSRLFPSGRHTESLWQSVP